MCVLRMLGVGFLLAVAALAVLLLAPGFAAANGIPCADVNDCLTRSYVGESFGGDGTLGNFWSRQDRFTNTSEQTIEIALDECLLLNPEDVGFSNVEWSNVYDVQAEALDQYGDDFPFIGINFWWSNEGEVDSPEMYWTSAEFFLDDEPAFPPWISLQSGESFVLNTVVHNDILGPVPLDIDDAPELVGELVIGWRFRTVDAPEPSTSLLLLVSGVLLRALARRRTAR